MLNIMKAFKTLFLILKQCKTNDTVLFFFGNQNSEKRKSKLPLMKQETCNNKVKYIRNGC